jgi:hypothetical protein
MSITESSKIRVSDLDFKSIKDSFKEYLGTQAEFADYDFEASGMSVIMDLLSYNTYYNSVLANYVANETFIDSAVKRDSVVSHAKALGYRPKSVKSSRAKIQLTLTNAIGEPNQLVMKSGTPFETTVREQSYQFVTLNDVVATKDAGEYNFGEFDIFQGQFQQNTYIAEGRKAEKFTLPNPNVDISSIAVIVQTSATVLDYYYYTHADTLVDIDSTSKVFFVQEGISGKSEIYFGDGIIGSRLSAGNVVTVTYITSQGQDANDAKVFKLTGTIEGNSVVSIRTIENAGGGANPEDIESIRFNAMSYFGVQNRAVTADDYRALILQNFQNVKSCVTWGGEKQTPPEYGKVFVCIQPKNSEFLTASEKADVVGIIKKRAVANVTTKFADPEYVDIEIVSDIYYDSIKNNKSTVELKNIVLATITEYSEEYLGKFDDTFRSSQLSRLIDNSDFSILNNLTSFKVFKSFLPILYTENIVNFSFFNEIRRSTQYETSVISSFFNINELSEKVFIRDNLGTIQVVYYDNNGIIKIHKNNHGTVNYDTGVIQLSPLNITNYDGNEIRFFITPKINDIFSKNSSIVRLQPKNVTLNVIVDNLRKN